MIDDELAERIEKLRPPWHMKKRNETLKAEYQQARELACGDSAPTPEEIAEAETMPDDEEIVVDLDALQDPFELEAGIARVPRRSTPRSRQRPCVVWTQRMRRELTRSNVYGIEGPSAEVRRFTTFAEAIAAM
jgi:hypothetical protein